MAGRKFNYWLVMTLADEREKARVPRQVIATLLDVGPRTIERLEDIEEPETKGYSQDLDRIVAAYAYALGKKDARDLWEMALARWRKEGAPPDFSDDLPGSSFLRAIQEEARRQSQAPDARSGRRSATRRSRGAG